MDIQPITCSGINSQLKAMQTYVKKINNMLYDMGHGVYDLMYHGYTQEQSENAKYIYEQLKEHSKQMSDILEKVIYKEDIML